MDEFIDPLLIVNVFTTLDANSNYWQVQIRKQDRDPTPSVYHRSLFRFRRMNFGFTNPPASFQRALDVLLAGYKLALSLVYLDYVIIFSKEF